jgi:hypothetical protein
VREPRDGPRPRDLARQQYRVRRLPAKDIVAADDTHATAALDNRQVVDAPTGHLEERFEGEGRRRRRHEGRRHDRHRARGARVAAGGDELATQVSVRDDAHG